MVSLCNLINRPYHYFVLLFIMAMVYNVLLGPTFQVFCARWSNYEYSTGNCTYAGGTNTATIEGNRTNFNLVGFGGRMAKTEPR